MGTYVSEIIEVKINNRWRTLKTYYDSSVYKDIFEDEEELIDEFDAFYHYDLSFKVCKKLFAFPNQIFVTSHNTYLMSNDLLRPDCNFIINKNQIKPLSLCTDKELRWGNNIEKMYRGNAFEV